MHRGKVAGAMVPDKRARGNRARAHHARFARAFARAR
jgi:hypothetical protein